MTARPTAAANDRPTIATASRWAAGAMAIAHSTRLRAAVACPLGHDSGATCSAGVCGAWTRSTAVTTLSTWLTALGTTITAAVTIAARAPW